MSFKVIDDDTTKKHVTSACMCLHICNRFHAKQANSEKIATFKGVLLFVQTLLNVEG